MARDRLDCDCLFFGKGRTVCAFEFPCPLLSNPGGSVCGNIETPVLSYELGGSTDIEASSNVSALVFAADKRLARDGSGRIIREEEAAVEVFPADGSTSTGSGIDPLAFDNDCGCESISSSERVLS